MEIIVHVQAEIPSVFLLNGSFVERADAVRYRSDQPLYVTVLPLEALYLPYTVKLLGGKAVSNRALTAGYALGGGRFLVKCKARYNYVYAVPSARSTDDGLVPRFFRSVKEGSFLAARACLTHELSASLTDDGLTDFFLPYCDLAEDTFTRTGGWYFLREDGEAMHCAVSVRSGLIDNLTETEG